MQDSGVFISDDELSQFKIMVACECYSDQGLVRDVLTQLPDRNGEIIWGSPRVPDPFKLIDADLVLILSDRANLLTAIGRSVIYKNLGLAHLLIYVQDETDLPIEVIPGLVLPRSQLAADLLNLTQILLESTLTQGLVGVDWADTRNLLTMGDQIVMEKASGDEPEAVIKAAVSQLQARTSGRAIHGLQAAILSNGRKLPTRAISDLSWTCKDNLPLPDKDSAGYDTYFIVAAPLMDWPDDDHYEVRLFARVECTGVHWPSGLLLDFLDGLGA